MSRETVLGSIRGRDVTVADMITLLEAREPDEVLGELDGETVTVAEGLRRMHRAALYPDMVPVEDRLSDEEWAEAVIVRGEAPYGRCPFCQTAKGAAGCLNLCDMPAAAAQEFTNGLMNVLEQRRAKVRWVEDLAGCTCGPPRLHGYAIQRDSHDRWCPMNPANREDAY